MKKVLILYKFLPQYRIDFFNLLREELKANNICLELGYGKNKNADSLKKDELDLEWALYRENKFFKIGKINLLWQPFLDIAKESDLIIVEQANSLLINYLLMFIRFRKNQKFAYWGHGANLQESSTSLKNKFKYFFLDKSDWWFAYTNSVKQFLIYRGINNNEITVVQNAIDTNLLVKEYDLITPDAIKNIKDKMHINSENIAIFCGALYKEKRLTFLIDAAVEIKKIVTDFNLIIIGSGIDMHIAQRAEKEYEWIHYIGPKFGKERVIYFKMSKLFLMPGLVGLAILDSFAMQTPMVTVVNPSHGPEIEYLENNKNGIIVQDDIISYIDKIVELLKSENLLNRLNKGCCESSKKYTVEKMVRNFAQGIYKCLG